MPPRGGCCPGLIGCYAFLYAPIAFLIWFSFNECPPGHRSGLGSSSGAGTGCWSGDATLINAALLSLRIAAVSASHRAGAWDTAVRPRSRAVRLGPRRAAFEAALFAPLILPEVITGLSLLLLFVVLENAIGWPSGRGAGTVTIAHASVSVAYVAVVTRVRLADTGTALEEAAADLYAPPWKVFALVTVPLLMPALVAGWLMAFTLSLDDVVVASFTSGPGASTLPMVVFSATRLGVTPEIYALATVIVAVVSCVLLIAARLRRIWI